MSDLSSVAKQTVASIIEQTAPELGVRVVRLAIIARSPAKYILSLLKQIGGTTHASVHEALVEPDNDANTFWHELVTESNPECELVEQLTQCFPELMHDTDGHGRDAYAIAVASAKRAMVNAVCFCGRFELGLPLHQTSTSCVLHAIDRLDVNDASCCVKLSK